MDWLGDIDAPWVWLIAGVVLAGAEMLLPGYFLIWMAAAAITTGMIAAVVDIPVAVQVLSFVVFSALSVYAAREWLDYAGNETTDPAMNDRGARAIGARVVVTQAIEDGEGRVRLGDSEWIARGPDAAIGTRLEVTGHDGAVLLVGSLAATHIAGNERPAIEDRP
ncbi:NfeD family protein [Croceicoccus sp. BE223]|uniref:NfeD family protein n=1 Tax=Croceicoccus sp. BE223 TaxID=2817716 RepID=UPI00286128B5|nr:NfeD family protein [Croceicoccus sp. BE223]MDR7100933.1 membrane protein implicated in regulation of membrane protease activity [Croceicoccus sp. BE223]